MSATAADYLEVMSLYAELRKLVPVVSDLRIMTIAKLSYEACHDNPESARLLGLFENDAGVQLAKRLCKARYV